MSSSLPVAAADPNVAAARLAAVEFVPMTAALMALNALAVDIMLPALGRMASDLDAPKPNDQQLIVLVYILGFGAPQLIFGPLSDRFGRRPVLFGSLIGYALASVACIGANSFFALLAARFIQGVFAAGCRVVAVATVRDLYSGREMARLMSLVMTVFMAVPIFAPSIGQLILFVAPWQWCFGVLAASAIAMLVWTALRLPETLAVESRRPLSLGSTLAAYREVLQYRTTRGYMIASSFIFGALFAFVSSSEQVFREVFETGDGFALWFAGVAVAMSAANFMNSRLVDRFGMRKMGHLALLGFLGAAAILTLLMALVGEHLVIFFPLFAFMFACFGVIGSNFNALAMEPLGRVAGTGAAAYGFATTTGAGFIGGMIARSYDGSTIPLLLGFVGLSTVSLTLVLWTERGRLFDLAS